MRCKWCGSKNVKQGRDECPACYMVANNHVREDPRAEWLVKRDMSAEYRRRLGYSTGEPGAEVPDDDE
jgi:hypothetical protein